MKLQQQLFKRVYNDYNYLTTALTYFIQLSQKLSVYNASCIRQDYKYIQQAYMSESYQDQEASHQTTFTFQRQPSKEESEKMEESEVDQTSSTSPLHNATTECQKQISYTLDKLNLTNHSSPIKTIPFPIYSNRSYESPIITHPDPEQEDDYDHPYSFSYLQLTSKLQSALNKIATSKRTINSTSRSSQNIIHRFQELEQRKQEQLQKMQEEKELQIIREVKKKPTINQQSERLMKEAGYQPIYVRYEEILEKKKKQLEENQRNKAKQEEQKEAQFLEQLNQHTKKPENARTYDTYYTEMVKWKESLAQQNRQKQQKKRMEQSQELTFRPKINKKTNKIMQFQSLAPIYERGLVREKPKPLYTFTPKLSRRAK